MDIRDNTPVEVHSLNGVPVFVKREDLCTPEDGPRLAKVRGLAAYLAKRPELHIGVLDGYHSKNGWATAWVASQLGKWTTVYWPKRVTDKLPRLNQVHAADLGARLVSLKAGRNSVLQHQASHLHYAHNASSLMLPNGLKLEESIEETEKETRRTFEGNQELLLTGEGTLVIPVGTGTMACGLTRALPDSWDVVYVLGYSQPLTKMFELFEPYAPKTLRNRSLFVDQQYQYSESSTFTGEIPFPTCPYYEAKAWGWMATDPVLPFRKQPILFWNFGI